VLHQVWHELAQPSFSGIEVERERRHLVHDGDGCRVAAEVDTKQVLAAVPAPLDPELREYLLFRIDG
jgi:hypothetical protein